MVQDHFFLSTGASIIIIVGDDDNRHLDSEFCFIDFWSDGLDFVPLDFHLISILVEGQCSQCLPHLIHSLADITESAIDLLIVIICIFVFFFFSRLCSCVPRFRCRRLLIPVCQSVTCLPVLPVISHDDGSRDEPLVSCR